MLSELTLGESNDVLEIQTNEQARESALALAQQAHRSLMIVSSDLDHFLYDTQPFAQAITNMAAASRYSKVRVLIHSSEKCVKEGHRLVTVSQRLTSHVFIRLLGHDHKDYNEAFMVADETGYMYRPLSDRFEGKVCFADRRQSRRFAEFFNEAWEYSEADAGLRRLHI